jgi:transposase-like protein
MVRNSLKYVSYKDRKAVAADLKQVYSSVTAEQAEHELGKLADKWDSKYPAISRSWQAHWDNIIPLFDYPDKIIYMKYVTTNAIESLNSFISKAIKNRKIFPNNKSAFNVVYLAMKQASENLTMPIRNWLPAMNRFSMEYRERVDV